ncbi:hypothetical protein M5K25_018881 [Dendrobium thyrsiflorum]|uniref:Uncharacterized protein n=1 Tax=Dendrobium thyrsiflorum TaxID=117978 RepID=A0ABD0UDL2_DENTH
MTTVHRLFELECSGANPLSIAVLDLERNDAKKYRYCIEASVCTKVRNPKSFFFILKKAENLKSFFTLLVKAENLDLMLKADNPEYFFFLLKKAENLKSFFTLVVKADNLDLIMFIIGFLDAKHIVIRLSNDLDYKSSKSMEDIEKPSSSIVVIPNHADENANTIPEAPIFNQMTPFVFILLQDNSDLPRYLVLSKKNPGNPAKSDAKSVSSRKSREADLDGAFTRVDKMRTRKDSFDGLPQLSLIFPQLKPTTKHL